DLSLSRRLERTEARASAAFVEARAQLSPESRAAWTDVEGAYAMFDGVGSPLTQSFGLGLFAPVHDAQLDALEAFFRERGAEVFHEVSPLADSALLDRLSGRGYRPVELTSVLFRPTAGGVPSPPGGGVRVRRAGPDQADLWARVAAEGWSSESAELSDFMLELGQVSAASRDTHCFLAELDGRPVAAGTLSLGEGVALLAGASTVPAGRRKGAQLALLEARLRFAAERGYDLAMMGAQPGSASQRNAERQGFRIAYTRIKWHLRGPGE
ncbi:MAG TPA: GNAT family N-acetyltransferase, partial [Longimicrobiaceae bacterium]|nr:GNAT family N-acetyltransferase [Longimicrobiaceae bacterium]